MFRALLVALAMSATPAFAGDELLKQLMDGDGPAVTLGVPDITNAPSTSNGPSRSKMEAACGGEFNHDLAVDDPCSGWHFAEMVDFGDGPEPSYYSCDMLDPATDSCELPADGGADADCPPERFGVCPELLNPEDRAEWERDNPGYDTNLQED
jgi:hypothetical protein